MQNVETNIDKNKSDIIWNNPENALAALEKREDLVLAEAEKFWIGEIQCTEFSHRNEADVCDFLHTNFSDLEELIILA